MEMTGLRIAKPRNRFRIDALTSSAAKYDRSSAAQLQHGLICLTGLYAGPQTRGLISKFL